MEDEITHDEINQYEEFLKEDGETHKYKYAIQQAGNYIRRKAHGKLIAPGCYHVRQLPSGDAQWMLGLEV